MTNNGDNFAMAEFEHLEAVRGVFDDIRNRAVHDMLTLEESLQMLSNGGDEDLAIRESAYLQRSQPEVFEAQALDLWAYGEDCKDKLNKTVGLVGSDPMFAETEWQDALVHSPVAVRRSLHEGIVRIDFNFDI